MALKKKVKLGILGVLTLAIIGGGVAWYLFTEKFDDTSSVNADFTMAADSLLHDFVRNPDVANKKYTEKILQIKGRVHEIEPVDSLVNVKFIDSLSGNYLIFSFQDKDALEAKKLSEGEEATIRASCSGGVHSEILDLYYISFKRAALIKK